MNFLHPGFLFALLAIAIPVIIHLFNFRRFKKVYFSNVAFLQDIKEQNSSREKIKNLLLLSARILAISFLVFAFARPFLATKNKIDQSKGNTVSIYIDNSFSMEAVNQEGSLLDEAKRKAKDIVKSFQLNDRFQLLTNDFEGKHQRLLNADELLQDIDLVKVSQTSRSLQQVLIRQQGIFTGVNNRFSFVISDFQKGFAGDLPIAVEANTITTLVQLNSKELPNVAVDSVWSLSPTHQTNTTEKLVVQLKNYGGEDAKNVPIKLTINNQQKAVSTVSIPTGKVKRDTISYSGLELGWQKATIGIKDFPLTFDDELNFSFNVSANQSILSINGVNSGRYIKALFGADPYFKLSEMPEANINYASLQNYSLIVLNEVTQPSSGLAQTLKAYVANGGSVVIFPDLNAEKEIYSAFLKAINLPGVAELKNQTVKASSIELKNPLFKGVYESLPKNLYLPQVNKYFRFAESNNSNKENLLQLPGNNLFFARYGIGNGKVYLAATSLQSDASNFSRHPIFLPLLYKIAFSSRRDQPLYYVTGKDNIIESKKVNLGTDQSLSLIGDGFEVIPEVRNANGKTLLYVADQIKKAGFYELKNGDSTLAVVAFNDNRIESEMHYDTKAALQSLFNKQPVSFLDAKPESNKGVIAENKGTELWKLCLILALIFLAIEILIVRFYSINKIEKS